MRWKAEQYAMFSQQLRQLLSSGLTIVPSLQAMQEQRLIPQPVSEQLIKHLERGNSFADALWQLEFTKLFVSFIRVAEEHGQLEDGLSHCEHFYTAKAKWRGTIQRACIYPFFVLMMILITLVLLFQLVLPRFADLYTSLGIELPFFTRILFTSIPYIPWVGAILFTLVGFLFVFKSYSGLQPLFYQLPGIHRFYRLRWTHYLSIQLGALLQAGIPLLSAIQLIEEVTPWDYVAKRLMAVKAKLLAGEPFHQSVEQEAKSLVTPSFPQLVALGEQYGRLDQALLRIAKTTEIQIQHQTEKLMKMVEPGFLLVIGGMVALTMLSLFLPMISLVDAM